MITAAMDLGSNTLRLLVVQVDDLYNQKKVILREIAVLRLGHNLKINQFFDFSVQADTFIKVAEFTCQARALGASRVVLGATQACRIAKNGSDFIARLGQELSLDQARVLSSKEEAQLSCMGVLDSLVGSTKDTLLVDIGGGSSELIELTIDNPKFISLSLGALSLAETHFYNDPLTLDELAILDAAIDEQLVMAQSLLLSRCLVICGGTASTLAGLVMDLAYYDPARINNLRITRDQLEKEIKRLVVLNLSDRQRILKLDPLRADIIIAGLAIIRGLLRMFNLNEFIVMDSGLLEGIFLYDLANTVK